MGNIGPERRRIEVLPLREPARQPESVPAPAEPRPAQTPAPSPDPVPAN
jgi:hypothetical protein